MMAICRGAFRPSRRIPQGKSVGSLSKLAAGGKAMSATQKVGGGGTHREIAKDRYLRVLKQVFERLAPFSDEVPSGNISDVRGLLRWKHGLLSEWPSRAEAWEFLEWLAGDYRISLDRERTSIRLKDLINELSGLGSAAQILRVALERLSSDSRFLIDPGWGAFHAVYKGAWTRHLELFEAAGGEALLLPSNARKDRPASDAPTPRSDEMPWRTRLLALEKLAAQLSNFVLETYGTGDKSRPDPGGATNFAKQFAAPAKRLLVKYCWTLVEQCKPGRASGTIETRRPETRILIDLVNAVHAYVTLGDWKSAKFDKVVTVVAGQRRKFHEVLEERFQTRRRINKLDPTSGFYDAATVAAAAPGELEDLLAAEERLRSEIEDLEAPLRRRKRKRK